MRFFILIPICLLLYSCTSSNILIDKEFTNNVPSFNVSGASGFVFKSKIIFGPYTIHRTSPDEKSLESLKIIAPKLEPKSWFAFKIKSEEENISANVICSNTKREFTQTPFKKSSSQTIPPELSLGDFWEGNILTNSYRELFSTFSFNLEAPINDSAVEAGDVLTNKEGLDISVIELRNRKKNWITGKREIAYALYINKKIVGAISINKKGKVWIDNNLSSEQKILAAGTAGILLIKPRFNMKR